MSEPVLITGGAGYIGSHTVLALLDAGQRAVVLDDLSTGSRNLVPEAVPLEIGDVRDEAFVEDVIRRHGCKAAIHFAAKIAVEESVREPLAYWSVNLEGTRALLEAGHRAKLQHLVFSSTAAVYGEAGEKPICEDSPCRPLNPYGRAKLAAEWLIGDAALAWGLNHVVLRYFNVAGADPLGRSGQCGPESTHLLRVACETALGKRPRMEIFGTDYPTPDGTAMRDFIHVSDVAQAHLAALAHLARAGGRHTFNLGYGQGYSVRQVISAIEAVVGKPLAVREAPRRAGDSAAVVADSQSIRTVLGWAPRHNDLGEIVRTALAWERARS
jgi:UDP-glucose 4-epimerase